MHLVDRLDGVDVVDTRIEADLVHDDNACLLDLLFELADAGADVACRDDVRLTLDRCLDDIDVVSVRNERDDEVVLRDLLLKLGALLRLLRASVQREGGRVGQVIRESLSTLQSATGYARSADTSHTGMQASCTYRS